MSHSDNSVTQWISALKAGDESAAAKLWQRYYGRLKNVARKRFGAGPRRVSDEEDVALSAFHSFCRGLKADRFPHLHDRDDLWRLVVCITERKTFSELRAQGRLKRGAQMVASESALLNPQASSPQAGLDELAGPEPTPEFAAEMCEAVNRLMGGLGDDELRQIAWDKLDGYSNEEIAQRIGRALTTVERRLRLIRKTWLLELGDA
jgi:DNA-directed RNA polymerase specialized sigma24 family protein